MTEHTPEPQHTPELQRSAIEILADYAERGYDDFLYQARYGDYGADDLTAAAADWKTALAGLDALQEFARIYSDDPMLTDHIGEATTCAEANALARALEAITVGSSEAIMRGHRAADTTDGEAHSD